MKRAPALVPLAAALVLACATPPKETARDVHASPLGYRAVVPSDWMLVDRAALADLFESSESAAPGGIDPRILAAISKNVESGAMEMLLLATGTTTFRDNLNVLHAPGTIPASKEAVPFACAMLARQLSEALRRVIAFDRCGLEDVGGKRALVLHYPDSQSPGQATRTLQFYFTRTESTVLVVTGTFVEETAETNEKRLRAFVDSMEIDARSDP